MQEKNADQTKITQLNILLLEFCPSSDNNVLIYSDDQFNDAF